MRTVKLADVVDCIPANALLLCCASYEERSVTLPSAIGVRDDVEVRLCFNEESLKDTAENRAAFARIFGRRLKLFRSRKRDPFFTADVLFRALDSSNSREICIDISTFTREAIFLMIRIIDELELYDRTHFFYTRAAAYSIGSRPGQEWLSKGVTTVRSILGYPGDLTPGRPLHLIFLPGVEFDRAMRLCEEFEPNHVSIGIGAGDRDFDRTIRERTEQVGNKIKQFNASCSTFTFSTVDVIETAAVVTDVVMKKAGFNCVIAAMSNKISTIGVALVGIAHQDIQMAYAEPVKYNVAHYSTPGDEIIFFRLRKNQGAKFEYFD